MAKMIKVVKVVPMVKVGKMAKMVKVVKGVKVAPGFRYTGRLPQSQGAMRGAGGLRLHSNDLCIWPMEFHSSGNSSKKTTTSTANNNRFEVGNLRELINKLTRWGLIQTRSELDN